MKQVEYITLRFCERIFLYLRNALSFTRDFHLKHLIIVSHSKAVKQGRCIIGLT